MEDRKKVEVSEEEEKPQKKLQTGQLLYFNDPSKHPNQEAQVLTNVRTRERSTKEKDPKNYIIIAAAILLIVPIFQFISQSVHSSPAPTVVIPQSGVTDTMLMEPLKTRSAKRPNPSVSWFEWLFCRGRHVSQSCSKRAYHPYLEWYEDHEGELPPGVKHRAQRELNNTFGQDR